ncbi:MAG: endolytic transglycosylase MltG [Clostridiales Family XIII bacterium]|nr:endolytic transglycosylase MltG [Clostridiales Family XIII bacterium]
MQKIKDIFYDTNDVIVALIIIALAALLIWNRIGVILSYPASGTGGSAVYGGGADTDGAAADEADAGRGGGVDLAVGDGAASGTDADVSESGADGAEADGTNDAGASGEPVQFSFYIAYGETAAQIAQKLLDAGLISSNNEFYDALLVANAATRLQAGTFIIEAGTSPAEIVAILTGH